MVEFKPNFEDDETITHPDDSLPIQSNNVNFQLSLGLSYLRHATHETIGTFLQEILETNPDNNKVLTLLSKYNLSWKHILRDSELADVPDSLWDSKDPRPEKAEEPAENYLYLRGVKNKDIPVPLSWLSELLPGPGQCSTPNMLRNLIPENPERQKEILKQAASEIDANTGHLQLSRFKTGELFFYLYEQGLLQLVPEEVKNEVGVGHWILIERMLRAENPKGDEKILSEILSQATEPKNIAPSLAVYSNLSGIELLLIQAGYLSGRPLEQAALEVLFGHKLGSINQIQQTESTALKKMLNTASSDTVDYDIWPESLKSLDIPKEALKHLPNWVPIWIKSKAKMIDDKLTLSRESLQKTVGLHLSRPEASKRAAATALGRAYAGADFVSRRSRHQRCTADEAIIALLYLDIENELSLVPPSLASRLGAGGQAFFEHMLRLHPGTDFSDLDLHTGKTRIPEIITTIASSGSISNQQKNILATAYFQNQVKKSPYFPDAELAEYFPWETPESIREMRKTALSALYEDFIK